MRRRWDLRTACLALGAWAGAAAGWSLGWPVALLLGGLAAVVLLVPRPVARHVALVAAGATAGAAVASLGAAARELPASLQDATAEYVVEVTTEGRPVAVPAGRTPQRLVEGTLRAGRTGTRTWELAVPTRLIVDADTWSGCAACSPGAAVRLHGTIVPAAPQDPVLLLRVRSTPAVMTPPQGGRAAAASVRAGLRTALTRQPREAASLVSGLALGDESEQQPTFAATMQAAGLAHLTAVSGGNLVIVLLLAVLPLRLLRLPVPAQVAGCVAAVGGYVWLVGPQPSVLRAAVMAAAGLVGVLLGGPARGVPILFGGVFLLLLVAPALAFSLGFALSVAATAGLQLLAPPLAAQLRRVVPDSVALALAVTLAAQVTSAPILLAAGLEVSPVAVPANLAAAPLVAPITAGGLAAALLAIVAPAPAQVVAASAAVPAAALAWIARSAESLGHAPWLESVTTWSLIAATVVVWVGWVRRCWPDGWRAPALAGAAAAIAVGLLAPWRPGDLPDDWRAVVCDVGQGTAVLLRTAGAAVLVDTGPAEGDIAGCLRRADVTRLDAVVLSHFHADHVGALAAVLRNAPAGQIVIGPSGHPVDAATQVRAEAGSVPLAVAAAGQRLRWDGLTADVLWPRPGDSGSAEDVNDGSLVLVARFDGGGSVLLPGDVEPDSQVAVMAAWPGPAADVTVIPHHGSGHQDPRFAAWSGAHAAAASAGADNSYGHPSPDTLAEYTAMGADVRRTDTDGAVAYTWHDGAVLVTSAR